MLRRLSCLALALVFAAFSVFSSAAWSADSFISGGSEYEPSSDVSFFDDLPVPDVYAAPRRAPRMVKVSAADQAAAETDTTGKLVVPATLPTSVDGTFEVMSKYYIHEKASDVSPGFNSDYWRDVVATLPLSPVIANNLLYIVPWSGFTYSPSIGSSEKVRGLALFCDKNNAVYPPGYISVGGVGSDVGKDSWPFTVNYDVSSHNSSAFSLDGVDGFQIGLLTPANSPLFAYPLSVDVLVDGQQVLSLSRGSALTIDFGGYVFSGSKPISTISFRWHMDFIALVFDSLDHAGACYAELRSIGLVDSPDALTISFLDGQDVINAQNNKTKEDINKHEEYESQWTGSMTENFNALGFSDFSWSDSLVSGFSLFSGIFMDIWRALGGATILFTFPLLLGIALLLVGRISRSGGRSGSGKGGGDAG